MCLSVSENVGLIWAPFLRPSRLILFLLQQLTDHPVFCGFRHNLVAAFDTVIHEQMISLRLLVSVAEA